MKESRELRRKADIFNETKKKEYEEERQKAKEWQSVKADIEDNLAIKIAKRFLKMAEKDAESGHYRISLDYACVGIIMREEIEALAKRFSEYDKEINDLYWGGHKKIIRKAMKPIKKKGFTVSISSRNAPKGYVGVEIGW